MDLIIRNDYKRINAFIYEITKMRLEAGFDRVRQIARTGMKIGTGARGSAWGLITGGDQLDNSVSDALLRYGFKISLESQWVKRWRTSHLKNGLSAK